MCYSNSLARIRRDASHTRKSCMACMGDRSRPVENPCPDILGGPAKATATLQVPGAAPDSLGEPSPAWCVVGLVFCFFFFFGFVFFFFFLWLPLLFFFCCFSFFFGSWFISSGLLFLNNVGVSWFWGAGRWRKRTPPPPVKCSAVR